MTPPLDDPDRLVAELARVTAADLERVLHQHLKDNRELLSGAGMQVPDTSGASNSVEVIQQLAVTAQAFVREGGPSVTPRVRGAADVVAAIAAVWAAQHMRLQGRQGADQAAQETMAGILLGTATAFLRHEERGVYPELRKAHRTRQAQSQGGRDGAKQRATAEATERRRSENRLAWSAYDGPLSKPHWISARARKQGVARKTISRDIEGVSNVRERDTK